MNGILVQLPSPYAQVVNHRTGKPLPELSPSERIKTLWIYGLFDSAGVCHYAGQTKYPGKRQSTHLAKRPNLQFRVLRSTTEANVSRIEIQVIKAYQKRGQCKLNRQVYPFNARNKTPLIYSGTANRYFSSTEEAALFFGCCGKTVNDHLKGVRENYNQLRLVTLAELQSLR